MPRVRDLLYRFRPSGAPGGAGAAGVPVDREAAVVAELEPLFARLAEVERQCDSIQGAGHHDAAAIIVAATARAHDLATEADTRVRSARAVAAAQVGDRAAADGAATLARARLDAAAVRDRTEERMTAQVDRVTEAVRALVDAEQPSST